MASSHQIIAHGIQKGKKILKAKGWTSGRSLPVGNFDECPWENDAKLLNETSNFVAQLTIVVE